MLPAAQDNLLAVKSSRNAVHEVDRERVKEGIESLRHDWSFTAMSNINSTSFPSFKAEQLGKRLEEEEEEEEGRRRKKKKKKKKKERPCLSA
ncbi:hypothetical protein KOW79_005687 [Hemibagrus wyckioides]|uniref:Uncharacterized protein n=1 Tax=Hemibagrus wyckioides TaxID=337641 RepID=A0A9D3NZ98_9TELE|nr:hypothetical protein KOW79_005687 [Hemibagrus wyckioides]